MTSDLIFWHWCCFNTTGRRRVKKVVVCVAQLVAALITVHGLLSFLSDVYGLFDPSCQTLWLSEMAFSHRIKNWKN